MQCPSCHHVNLPGDDDCSKCGQDLYSINPHKPMNEMEASIIQDPVVRLKPRAAITVSPDTPILEVSKIINSKRCSVLVVEGDQLKGILTERDILYKALEDKMDLAKTPASKIMTPVIESIHSDDSIACALHIMSVGGFRNIPVMHGGKPMYIVTVWDILRYISEHCKSRGK